MFFLFALGAFFFLFARPAQAYIDPGTGSFIFQLLIGFVVGGAYLVKVFWHKLMLFFSGRKVISSDSSNEENK